MIFILFFKYGIFPYLLHNYGLRTCLLISPILIAVFTALIIAIGLFMGYTPGTPAGFILFFLLLAVLRIISKSLKDTVEFPTFQVIYHSIDEVLKSEFQSEAAGSLNEISVFFAGVLLTGFGLFSFIKLIHFSLILLILAFVWMFVALRLFRNTGKR
jgi:AAA family ATP:ADP antiporter